MTNLLFDLDGTLVDSSPGILAAFAYAFDQLGMPCPSQNQLLTLIGPPLEITFTSFCSSEEEVKQAIQHFRDYYDQTGLHQSQVYSGVKETLTKLASAGHQLFVATSKNEPVAKLMLQHLDLSTNLTAVYGSVKGRYHKADVIRACLVDKGLQPDQTVMIGDTSFDMIGAKALGLQAIGVTWGFGQQEDLIASGSDLIIDQPADLLSYFP